MERHGDEIHITTEEARGGVTNHGVRYVLAIGLLLAILALSAVWITGALTGEQNPPKTSTNRPADNAAPF
jgi:hypothetical protein